MKRRRNRMMTREDVSRTLDEHNRRVLKYQKKEARRARRVDRWRSFTAKFWGR